MSGGGGEDPQKLKRIAAAAYDYDNDPRWADYWSNVLIPPHMASRSDVVKHFKQKFYQRYIDPDLIVEPMSSTSSSQSARTSVPPPQSSSSSATSNSNTHQGSSGSSRRTSGSSTTPPPNSTPLRWDQQTIQFSVNAWVFVVSVLAIFPVVPQNLANRAYRLSFLGTACSSLYSLYSVYGAWNLQAFQVWFQSVVVAKDFVCSIYCLTFVSSHLCLKFALIPIMCRALEHDAKFLRRNFSRSTLYRSQRNIIQTFMYWQLLKLMYNAPATASYHQSAWARIGQTVNPLIQRHAPFLKTPVSAIQRWWLREKKTG
ncbi:hypothetical protein Sango_0050700 [Sesamum angolense]|uniref:Transmembrane protein n=1 Tax=Sesamum angolense TaxID=2727404 RepID=A0AAE1XD71_9LAMI|nr:hypothetical protein Sango_0050700 [Sesamum angolense]